MLLAVMHREQVYDREEVLGRDSSSVFPSQAKAAAANGGADAEAIREMLGGRKFVTESEVGQESLHGVCSTC